MITGVADALSGARRREAGEFAALLEGGRVPDGNALAPLVGLARALAPAEHTPGPDFRISLRARLVAEAATRLPAVPAQRSRRPARPAGTRLRYAAAGVAVASVVTGVGATAASTHALPGDALYGLKLRIEGVQLSLADSDLERGRRLLEQANSRLGEVERLAASGTAAEPATRRDLADALSQMQRDTAAGAAALTRSYRDTGDQEPMLLLDRFVAQQQVRLGDLLVLLGPTLRARLTAATDALRVIGARAVAVVATAATATAPGAADPPGRAGGAGSATAGPGTDPVGGVVGGVGRGSDVGSVPGASTGASAGTGGGTGAGTSAAVPTPTVAPQPLPEPTPPGVTAPAVTPPAAPPAASAPAATAPAVIPPVASLPVATPTCVAVPPLTSC